MPNHDYNQYDFSVSDDALTVRYNSQNLTKQFRQKCAFYGPHFRNIGLRFTGRSTTEAQSHPLQQQNYNMSENDDCDIKFNYYWFC